MSSNNERTTNPNEIKSQNPNHGIWVGIDLGTSNSACAIWDSTRGSAKWMRLRTIATVQSGNGKDGRTVPSVVMLASSQLEQQQHQDERQQQQQQQKQQQTTTQSPTLEDISSILPNSVAWVGEAAIQQHHHQQQQRELSTTNTSTLSLGGTLIRSIKRIVGKEWKDLDQNFILSFPLELVKDESTNEVLVRITTTTVLPNNNSGNDQMSNINALATTKDVRPVEILAILLRSIRCASEEYLKRNLQTKRMNVPGGPIIDPNRQKHHKATKQSGAPVDEKNYRIRNVVVGVPAHFSLKQRQVIEDACTRAGFEGHVSTLLESTAAAMAYGLSFVEKVEEDAFETSQQQREDGANEVTTTTENEQMDENKLSKKKRHHQTVLVVDMGGGTTDVTIATKDTGITTVASKTNANDQSNDGESSSIYSVVVTEGDEGLGGDDMDQAILEFVLKNLHLTLSDISLSQRRSLLRSCRAAKEAFSYDSSAGQTQEQQQIIQVDSNFPNGNGGKKIVITQEDLDLIIAPWIVRARRLVETAVDRFREQQQEHLQSNSIANEITEVVLVGGTTRIRAVRSMLKELFPHVELCTSLDPMGSVAQGLAIQAAVRSNKVPTHYLRSALMLDSIPHAIGVQVNERFFPLLKRNARLPAWGTATFALADVRQPGVTIRAVELVEDGSDDTNGPFSLGNIDKANCDPSKSSSMYVPMSKEDFTFLLRRLPDKELSTLSQRTIEVGMKVDIDGKFIVSIFDELDPEQVRKRERYQQLREQEEKDIINSSHEIVSEVGYIADLVMAETEVTKEQILLLFACIGAFIVYVGTKIYFAKELLEDDNIMVQIV